MILHGFYSSLRLYGRVNEGLFEYASKRRGAFISVFYLTHLSEEIEQTEK